tara:strand:- start:1 stop:636 length:636 start_codon:yes stop_codon:yes gene_type:complete
MIKKNKFPNQKYKDIKNFFHDYLLDLNSSFKSLNLVTLKKIIRLLKKSYNQKNKKIFICGNGGSAALSDHYACDHQKILFETKKLKPIIISLVANSALGTAISNDVNYKSIFSEQLKQMARDGDILIVISASGNSKNVIEAIRWANKHKIISISFTGFDGGIVKKISKYNLHIESNNYGIIEANHQSIINIISQYIKMDVLSLNQIRKIKF